MKPNGISRFKKGDKVWFIKGRMGEVHLLAATMDTHLIVKYHNGPEDDIYVFKNSDSWFDGWQDDDLHHTRAEAIAELQRRLSRNVDLLIGYK